METNDNKTLGKMKRKILQFTDFYGQDFANTDEIEKAKTKQELLEIIDMHGQFLFNQANDAQNHLKDFKQSISRMAAQD